MIESVQNDPKKSPRLRSPAYPGINLETAIKKAKEFYSQERRSSANVKVAVQNWGFKPTSGGGYVVIAALKSFGLITEQGSGDSRTIQLSDLALRILLDERIDSPDREAAIKKAALSPKIHAQLWGKYGANNPSDGNLRHYLLFDLKFNENTVDDFIREYKDTIEFAKLNSSDILSAETQDKDEIEEEKNDSGRSDSIRVGDYVLWESNGQIQFAEPKRIRELSDDRQWAFVEGSNTGLPISELDVVDSPDGPTPAPLSTQPPRPRTWVEAQQLAGVLPTNTHRAGSRQDIFSLDEGAVKIEWPEPLSPESFEDLSAWLDVWKRKIGRSIAKRDSATKG